MGKTTLLRILAGQLTPYKGKRVLGHKVVVGYQAQEFAEILPQGKNLIDIIRQAAPSGSTDKDVRSVLGSFGFQGDDVHKQCQVLSGGEKIRLAFARIFINPPNLLILDEPTTHLDIAARAQCAQHPVAWAGGDRCATPRPGIDAGNGFGQLPDDQQPHRAGRGADTDGLAFRSLHSRIRDRGAAHSARRLPRLLPARRPADVRRRAHNPQGLGRRKLTLAKLALLS